MLLKEIKNIFHKELDVLYPMEEVDNFFHMLLEHYLGLERFILALDPNVIISKEEESLFFNGLSQLKLEKPIQYIIGEAHFMGLRFAVNKYVLIPRQETEELVRWILSENQNFLTEYGRAPRILDIGTGSGCIAIALAKEMKDAEILALDIADEALEIAHANAEQNTASVSFIKDNILDLVKVYGKFDIIVSNPPYVRELEKENMNNNVKKYEPNSALFVQDSDPLVFYREIINFSVTHLLPGGELYLEINQYLGEENRELLEEHNFSKIELRKDMFGNFRMLKGVYEV